MDLISLLFLVVIVDTDDTRRTMDIATILVVPPTLVIKLWLKNQIFIFFTSSLKPPADGALYYAIRFPRPRPL